MYKKYLKRAIDIILSFTGMLMLSWLFLIIIIAIKFESPGPIFFNQKRVGLHKKYFNIHKFRTMRIDTPKDVPTHLLSNAESYITKVGRFLRKTSLDELPQFWNVFVGEMSIIGPRPEVRKFVDVYTDEQMATLLVRPGISCSSSIAFANEGEILEKSSNPDETYVADILPDKSKMNLEYIKELSVFNDIRIIFDTIKEVL